MDRRARPRYSRRMNPDEPPAGAALLRWYIEAGVDEAIAEVPRDAFAPPASRPQPLKRTPTPVAAARRPLPLPPAVVPPAAEIARACATVAALKAAVEAFEGCALKKTAQRTVFHDGDPAAARVVAIGEAPGAEEDRVGLPFVGPSGQLLDRMLASIGLDRRANALITNVIYWRPPANRTPEPAELAQCLPFLQRLLELVAPEAVLLLGGPAATTVLGRPGDTIGRLRGRWHEIVLPGLGRPLPALATFHPSYLLRTPAQKRLAWQDMLMLKKRLNGAA